MYGIASAIGYARQGRLTTWFRAKLAAVAGLPRMLRKRRQTQTTITADPERLWELMERNWIAIKRREKRFDSITPESPNYRLSSDIGVSPVSGCSLLTWVVSSLGAHCAPPSYEEEWRRAGSAFFTMNSARR